MNNLFNTRYVTTGDSIRSIAMEFLNGVSTVQLFIQEVSEAILTFLGPQYMTTPRNKDEWMKISQEFFVKRGFPHVLGCIDGKHIRVVKPSNGGSLYYNYKNFHSLILLAICDSNYKFIYAQVGSTGSESDGGVFNASKFNHSLKNNLLDLPPEAKIHEFGPIPYYFLGDAAFAQSEHILRPYAGNFLAPDKENFNKKLSSCRICIEQTFGILSGRFRVLLNSILLEPNHVESVVLSICVLHNLLRTFEPNEDIPEIPIPETERYNDDHQQNQNNRNYRDILKSLLYF